MQAHELERRVHPSGGGTMSHCQNPFCDNQVTGNRKFCRDSCRVSFHANHKFGLNLVLRELVRWELVTMGTGAAKAELIARNVYRVAKGREPTR
jgi:hypothetical protein